MKKYLFFLFVLIGCCCLNAQTALYNSGNIRIHPQGQIGFHTDLINDAPFDENVGLAGFYGNAQLNVLGALPPTFFDVEIANLNGVFLQTGINNSNNTNFVMGNFLTPRTDPNTNYNFLQQSFYVGDNEIAKVDGYAAITLKQNFIFPVGDDNQLRPLVLNSESENTQARCAYFYEDPNNPVSIGERYPTLNKQRDIGFISSTEFWRLEGNIPSAISISWNLRSDIIALTDDVSIILIVGFSKAENRWVALGTPTGVGDLNTGIATSAMFIPDDFDAITFGTMDVPAEYLDLDNYLVSVNGDGINEALLIPELEQSPNNHLKIYNRFGQMVFDQPNYTDQFIGFSNVDNLVMDRRQGLPSGVYFYIVDMIDLGLEFQGFLYLTR